jgi:hypothetical protein
MVSRASIPAPEAADEIRVRRLVASVLASRNREAVDAFLLLCEVFADEQGDDRRKIELAEIAIEEGFTFTDRFAHDLEGYRQLLKVATEGRF